MTVDEAIREFISLIDEEIFLPSVTTVWADGEAPTYVLQKRGKWIDHAAEDCYRCSVCEEYTHMEMPRLLYHYCPNCGSRMDLDGDTE